MFRGNAQSSCVRERQQGEKASLTARKDVVQAETLGPVNESIAKTIVDVEEEMSIRTGIEKRLIR